MPLKPGKENIGANIKELEEHGTRPRSKKQILAIALNTARAGVNNLKDPRKK